MNLDSLAAPLIGAAVTFGAALIAHAIHDAYKQGRMESEIKHLKESIGSHETGMRGQIHENTNMLGRLRAVVYFIGKKLNLDIMKDLDDDK